MEEIKISGRDVPVIGLGTWHMGENPRCLEQEIQAIRTGIEVGARVIDTAEMYGEGKSERMIGKAISIFQREELYLTSKVYPWNASKEKLPNSLDRSLKRLETDYLDLYLLHWQGSVPLEETVEALEQAKKSGKIRAWGVSNFDTSDLERLYSLPSGKNCATNQVLYNLGSRGIEYDLIPWMQAHSLPLIAYSPIAQGDSLGDNFHERSILKKLAQKYDATIFQILLAWTLRDGNTIAIPQSSNAQHVMENIEASKIMLTTDDLAQLDQIYEKPTSKKPLDVL